MVSAIRWAAGSPTCAPGKAGQSLDREGQMNRTFQVVIGVCVVLLVIMLSVLYKGTANTESQVAILPPSFPVKPTVTPEPPHKPKAHIERRRSAPQPAATPEEREVPVMTIEVNVSTPPFPAAADVQAGMTKDEMITKFGSPRIAASWAENGYLAEKFIYTRDAQLTAVMLLNGEVVRSRTGHSGQLVRAQSSRPRDKAGSSGAESADRGGTKAP